MNDNIISYILLFILLIGNLLILMNTNQDIPQICFKEKLKPIQVNNNLDIHKEIKNFKK